jgi:hypothetical protein
MEGSCVSPSIMMRLSIPILAARGIDISFNTTNGPLTGTQMALLPTETMLWIAIVAAEPEISHYQPKKQ